MIDTCNDYAKEHNLKFSTNPVPKKSKTKCMAFLINERELRKLKLGNDDLPWWNYGKHLGNTITNSNNFISQDLKQKRARYIDKNNEICQEFGFAHPVTKFKLNQILNEPSQLEFMGKAARQLAEEKFSIDAQYPRFEKVLLVALD